jgi:hypothetical protein
MLFIVNGFENGRPEGKLCRRLEELTSEVRGLNDGLVMGRASTRDSILRGAAEYERETLIF